MTMRWRATLLAALVPVLVGLGLPPLALAANTPTTSCPATQIGENAQHTGHTCSVLSTTARRRWTAQLQGSPGVPLIVGGRVFTTTTGPDGSRTGYLYALDRVTGRQLWGPVALSNAFRYFPLAYGGGRVFVNDYDGNLRAFDAGTGRSLWVRSTEDGSSEPVFNAGTLYVHGGSSVHAVNAATGQPVWTSPYLDGDGSTVAVDGTGVYVSGGCSRFKLALDSGAVVWTGNIGCSGGGGGTVRLSGGQVWASTEMFATSYILSKTDGQQLATFTGQPGFAGRTAILASGRTLLAEDSTTQVRRWSRVLAEDIVGAPVTTGNGLAVVLTTGGHVVVLSASTGAVVTSRSVPPVVLSGNRYQGNDVALAVGEASLVVPGANTLTAFS